MSTWGKWLNGILSWKISYSVENDLIVFPHLSLCVCRPEVNFVCLPLCSAPYLLRQVLSLILAGLAGQRTLEILWAPALSAGVTGVHH